MGTLYEWLQLTQYGTSFQSLKNVQNLGLHPILDIDVQGAQSFFKNNIDLVAVFIKPPSLDDLKKRLEKRATETKESLQIRLNNAQKEMDYAKTSKKFKIIENHNLTTCYQEFRDYIISKLFS